MMGPPSTRKKSMLVDLSIRLLEEHRKNNYDSKKTNGRIGMTILRNPEVYEGFKVKDIKKIRLGDLLD